MFTFLFKRIRMPFYDVEGGGGGTPVPSVSNATPAAPTPEAPATQAAPAKVWGMPANHQAAEGQFNPLRQETPPAAVPVVADPVVPAVPAEPVVPETLDFGGRKVAIVDPVVRDIHQDYTNLNRSYTQSNQRSRDLETQNALLVAQLQQHTAQAPAAVAQPEPTPEPADLEAQKEAFMEKFYEDPMGALGDLMDKQFKTKVEPVLEPIHRQQEATEQQKLINTQVAELQAKYEDFAEIAPNMEAMLGKHPHLAQNGLENLYLLVKDMGGGANTPAPATPAATPPAAPVAANTDALLSDPAFIQKIMADTNIQQQIIGQYVTNLQQKQNGIPPVMGNQPGGASPVIPEQSPKTLRDASKAFRAHLKTMG